jgi:hypothetical protein
MYSFLEKMGWATFWANFSQSQLVHPTLPLSSVLLCYGTFKALPKLHSSFAKEVQNETITENLGQT